MLLEHPSTIMVVTVVSFVKLLVWRNLYVSRENDNSVRDDRALFNLEIDMYFSDYLF